MKCEHGYDCFYKVGDTCKFYDFSARSEEPLECLQVSVSASQARFELGQVVMTQGALASIPAEEITAALSRHMCGDWGEVCKVDKRENEKAVKHGYRILSAYTTQGGTKFWVITEWDRSATTVLLPSEY